MTDVIPHLSAISQVMTIAALLVCCVCLVPGLTFDEPLHRYTLDGVIVPSVTGILKASGLIDFSGIPESILETARRRGTTVHQAIDYDNQRDLDREQFRLDFPDYVPYFEAWLAFVAEAHYVPVFNEGRIASRRLGVAGTFDTIGLLNGQAALIDYATGRPEDVSKDYQTAAYLGIVLDWSAEPECDPQLQAFLQRWPSIKRYAVALKRNGAFTLHPYSDPADYRKFLTLVEAQRIVTARRGEWSNLAEGA